MKLLMKFFTNSASKAYLRGLSSEMGENTNAIRLELNRLTAAGLLQPQQKGNTVMYRPNTGHPFFKEIQRLVMKYMGLDNIIDLVSQKLGKIDLAFINGDYAKGLDSGVIDLVLVGQISNREYLDKLHQKAESISGRKIRILILTTIEFKKQSASLDVENALILLASEKSGFEQAVGYW